MKRDEITYPIVKKFTPLLFWYKCRFCGKEFKRELGFKIKAFKRCRAAGEYPIYESYCCNECATSEEEVKILIEKEEIDFNQNRPLLPRRK